MSSFSRNAFVTNFEVLVFVLRSTWNCGVGSDLEAPRPMLDATNSQTGWKKPRTNIIQNRMPQIHFERGLHKTNFRHIFQKRDSKPKTENKVQYQSPKRSQKEIAARTSKHKLLKTLAKSTIATELKWENESQEANLENKKYKKETQTKAESKSKTEFAILFRKRFSKSALKTDPIH